MKLFVMVIGFTILLEGMMPFFLPDAYLKMLKEISRTRPRTIRIAGFAAILTGLVILYLARELT